MIFVLEEVMHPQPEIFQAELAEVFPSYDKRIKVVLFEISPKLALPFLVLSPQKTERQKEQRYDDRSDDVDRKIALQGVDHIANILFTAVPSVSRRSSETAERSFGNRSQSRGYKPC